ncbi:MAG: UvrD-helicase domain-containing protein [Patescibacteria group bacterium]
MLQQLLSKVYVSDQTLKENLAKIESVWNRFKNKRQYLTYKHKDDIYNILYSPEIVHLLNPNKFQSLISNKDQKVRRKEAVRKIKLIRDDFNSYNEKLITELKTEHDDFLSGKEDNISNGLDENQEKAVLCEEQHQLLVAGAGSGKTAVLTSKIAYLIRKRGILPKKILALAFNKSAADQLSSKLSSIYRFDDSELPHIHTFHAFGRSLLMKFSYNRRVILGDLKNELDSIFNHLIIHDKVFQKLALTYIFDYLIEEKLEVNFESKQEFYKYMNSKKYITLSGVKVKSEAERRIMNFLYQCDIAVEYEKNSNWALSKTDKENYKQYKPDFYLPKYDVYIECWGVDIHGKVPSHFKQTNYTYKQSMTWKKKVFQEKKKSLIEVFAYEMHNASYEKILTQRLKQSIAGISIMKIPIKELIEKLSDEKGSAIFELSKLVSDGITKTKTNGETVDNLDNRFKEEMKEYTKRQKQFASILLYVYKAYEKRNKDEEKLDFSDLINIPNQILDDSPDHMLDMYDYVLVDEFQDISKQRLRLIQHLVNERSKTKLFCVGDDWQSIYGFAGSELQYFTQFDSYFPKPDVMYLKTNYRSSHIVVRSSCHLISKNSRQYQKEVSAHGKNNDIHEFIKIIEISARNSKDYNSKCAQHTSSQIQRIINNNDKILNGEILVLARYKSSLNRVKDVLPPNLKKSTSIRFLSVHESKGVEAKHVFILDLTDDYFGFPSKILNDSVLNIVDGGESEENKMEEERRLFYVALTRSKVDLYLYTQRNNRSQFIHELDHKMCKFVRVY